MAREDYVNEGRISVIAFLSEVPIVLDEPILRGGTPERRWIK